jgi:hypothetical protein
VTATMPPLGPTAEAWDHLPVVDAIAAGPDWPERVRAYWASTVADADHSLSHPLSIPGCPGCPQVGDCPRCGLPVTVCDDPSGHYRQHRGSEESLLVGVVVSGGSKAVSR